MVEEGQGGSTVWSGDVRSGSRMGSEEMKSGYRMDQGRSGAVLGWGR